VKLKGIINEDFINYKKPCMTLEFPICKGFKCDKFNGKQVCQNSTLATEPNIEISADQIIQHYLNNPITEVICCQGLEPLDSMSDLMLFIHTIRNIYLCHDSIIIYTGYNKEEISDKIELLQRFDNIIIKFGRFIMNRPSRYDELLGVTLASDNQYAEQIS
jgi:hypothetical protein